MLDTDRQLYIIMALNQLWFIGTKWVNEKETKNTASRLRKKKKNCFNKIGISSQNMTI